MYCSLFLPENLRVECQGLGRAGRQGYPGSCEILISLDDLFVKKLLQNYKSDEVPSVKNIYMLRQKLVLQNSQVRRVHSSEEKKLFQQLSKFFTEFAQLKKNISEPKSYAKLDAAIKNGDHLKIKSLGKLEVLERVLRYVQNQWAYTFTKMTRNGNSEWYFTEFKTMVLDCITDVLSENPKVQNINALLQNLTKEVRHELTDEKPSDDDLLFNELAGIDLLSLFKFLQQQSKGSDNSKK